LIQFLALVYPYLSISIPELTGVLGFMFDLIAFDADDTLWDNERLYLDVQDRFTQLVSPYYPAGQVKEALYQTEMRNLISFGYGIKAFALSMIETAVEITEGKISSQELGEIVAWAHEMVEAGVLVFEGVEEVLQSLAPDHDLMLITKGDLADQQNKLAHSGLGQYFRFVEIVSHKTREIYTGILEKHAVAPERFLMVGNSLRSDILPVVELGGKAVYIPYHQTWAHENDVHIPEDGIYHELENISLLPEFVRKASLGEIL
jgi:putative hydrolase of the HAD superfamily